MRITLITLMLTLSLCGCYQISSNGDEDLRTVPVTNNPNITPQRSMGAPTAMPY
ncbi:MAG: hypothetical protein AB7N99_07160 [Simkaniaceae bacterium]